MRWWWHFDSGNFVLTGPRLSHESKCVSQAQEMEARSLWLWHPCEGLRLLGVKCDTSLGRCWFSVATAQQTSSHGVSRGVWGRGVGSTTHRTENGGLLLFIRTAVIWQLANHVPTPDTKPHPLPNFGHNSLSMHFFSHKGAMRNCFWKPQMRSWSWTQILGLICSVFPCSKPDTVEKSNTDLSPLNHKFGVDFNIVNYNVQSSL